MVAKLIIRFGNALFLAYLGGGVLFLILLESIFNGGFGVAMRLLSIPLAILTFGFTWLYRIDLYALGISRTKVWVMAILTYPALVLMGWPYVMAYNAATASGSSIVYSGPVIRKFVSNGRVKGYQVVIMDRSSRETVTLSVSSDDFARLSVGDSIQKSFHAGGLGLPYRWRFKDESMVAPDDR